ncbi:hypothetical protein [Kitasatospora sp. NPDC091207]|uniref:hypothetical protein n=1 Tax=Kitasatospora sp. NPDC091207 TaxID=3364083 RepID=UPI00381F2C66
MSAPPSPSPVPPPVPVPARVPARPAGRRRAPVAVLTVLALLLAGLWTAAGARAAADYTRLTLGIGW